MTPGVTVNQSMDERVREFRSDPEKMDVTTKFVNEVVEKAKDEAMKRMKENEKEKKGKIEGEKVQDANFNGGAATRRKKRKKEKRGRLNRKKKYEEKSRRKRTKVPVEQSISKAIVNKSILFCVPRWWNNKFTCEDNDTEGLFLDFRRSPEGGRLEDDDDEIGKEET